MTFLKNLRMVFIVGFVVSFVGALLHLIAMATTGWSRSSFYDIDLGVFRFCQPGNCAYYYNINSQLDVLGVQATTVIGFLFTVACIITGAVRISVNTKGSEPSKLASLVAGVLSIIAFIFVIVGVILWSQNVHKYLVSDYELSYSFILSIIGGVLLLLGGTAMLVTSFTSVGISNVA